MRSASLWQATMHYEAGKARPWMGLRNTIGIVAPLAAGWAAGDATDGMIAAMGALNVAVGDGSDPYAHRARRMLIASGFCAAAVAAGGLASGRWALTAILAAGAFAAGMMVAFGPAQADLGTMTLVVLIVFSAKPVPYHQALRSGLLALGGGLLQTGLVLALWPWRRYAPECRALSALYGELARAAEAASPNTEAPPASRQSTEAQQALSGLDARDSVDAERFLALLSQAERIRLSLLLLARLRARVGRESGTETATGILDRFVELVARALRHVGESIGRREALSPLSDLAPQMAQTEKDLRRACQGSAPAVAAMLSDALWQVNALAGQVRTVLEIANQTTSRGLAEFERREASRPWKIRVTGTLSTAAASLRLGSATFRHAVRLTVCVVAGEMLAHGLGWSRPYWVPMTVALVLKPDFTTTLSRGLQRLVETLLGLIVATALFRGVHPRPGLEIVFLGVFAFFARAYGPANYGILATAITGLVVFLFAVTGVSPADVVVARGLNTLVGGAIAMLAYRLWPTWERTQAPDALAHLLDAYRAYFQAVRAGYLGQDGTGGEALDRTRLAARIARSNLEASVGRMRAEPGNPADRVARFDRVLADSHRFIRAVMALEAGLLTSRAARAGRPFACLPMTWKRRCTTWPRSCAGRAGALRRPIFRTCARTTMRWWNRATRASRGTRW